MVASFRVSDHEFPFLSVANRTTIPADLTFINLLAPPPSLHLSSTIFPYFLAFLLFASSTCFLPVSLMLDLPSAARWIFLRH